MPVCLVEDDDDVVGGQWDHACLPSFLQDFLLVSAAAKLALALTLFFRSFDVAVVVVVVVVVVVPLLYVWMSAS